MSLISIVVPTHNESRNIDPLYRRVAQVFSGLPGDDFELIFCDDSADDTAIRISELHHADPRVKLVRLSRRFSQAVAISAGLQRCRGDATILMDADLQDPPEAIPEMIARWRDGFEVVYAQRRSASNYALYKLYSYVYYRALRKLASVDIPVGAGEFRLLDRKIVTFLQQVTEHTRFLRGLTVWPGLRQTSIKVERADRSEGQTNYNFRRSLVVAIDGLVSFSVAPLRWAMLAGLFIAVCSMLAGAGYVAAKLLNLTEFGAGWPSLMVSIFFLGGVQLMVVGIVGEYVGRIFLEVQNRPLYWIDFELGFDDAQVKAPASADRTRLPRA